MTDNISAFEDLRLNASSKFAQTMIVIDDEASQRSDAPHTQPTGTLRRPYRQTRSVETDTASKTKEGKAQGSGKHALDAKSLIDNAMDLGLICSVLRPKKGENFRNRVVRAAQVADIVCLDWEIYDDGGDAASEIISNIIQEDAQQNGRLRLIAIYTGDSTNNKILKRIFDEIPETIRKEGSFQKKALEIQSSSGVKIVCLFKTHGIQLQDPRSANQVSESELPERLQSEFAKLSQGLLSNVALVTIGAIRSSTHHVLSKFTGQMDGPYFHHRATIVSPEDAEEYAVDIVLSELKGAIDKHQVAARYAGPQAIEARIREMAGSAGTLTLRHGDEENPGTFERRVDFWIKMITDGLGSIPKSEKPPKSPKNEVFEQNLSTLFSDSREKARMEMHRFAALTGVRAHPGTQFYESGHLVAKLGLGTIIQNRQKIYLMCLQASCDSVRIRGENSFLFVPLDIEDVKPEHVVPVSLNANDPKYIGLSTSSKSYRAARSIVFSSSPETETVNATKIERCSGFHFTDTNGETYRWIADLKRRRALRTVQRLGQQMGRLGFDEFEPYRRRER